MSLNRHDARWYLIVYDNTTFSRAIVAAETSGSIVGRLKIVWVHEYGFFPNICHAIEGPVLSVNRKWLFVINATNILIIADEGDIAMVEYTVNIPGLCPNDMAYFETNSTLLIVDKQTYNIVTLTISTRNISYVSLTEICREKVIGQLTRMTIIQDYRLIIVVITATRKAVLLLLDYNQRKLLGRVDLGYISNITDIGSLTQVAYTKIDNQHVFVTIAHKAVGLVTVQLGTILSHTIFNIYSFSFLHF